MLRCIFFLHDARVPAWPLGDLHGSDERAMRARWTAPLLTCIGIGTLCRCGVDGAFQLTAENTAFNITTSGGLDLHVRFFPDEKNFTVHANGVFSSWMPLPQRLYVDQVLGTDLVRAMYAASVLREHLGIILHASR